MGRLVVFEHLTLDGAIHAVIPELIYEDVSKVTLARSVSLGRRRSVGAGRVRSSAAATGRRRCSGRA
jgi:hypothetical protein